MFNGFNFIRNKDFDHLNINIIFITTNVTIYVFIPSQL